MNTKAKLLLIALTVSGSAACLIAQDSNSDAPHRRGGPMGPEGHRPPPPIIAVLDANHDGIIDADEIANASKALLKLDKNGDGKLTPDELRPQRLEGGNGAHHGPGHPPVDGEDAPAEAAGQN